MVSESTTAANQPLKAQEEATNAKTAPKEGPALTLSELDSQVADVQQSVLAKETRLISRALRRFFTVNRKQLSSSILHRLVSQHYIKDEPQKEQLLSFVSKLPESMEVVEQPVEPSKEEEGKGPLSTEFLAEVEIYLYLLVTVALLDNKLYEEAAACSSIMISQLQTYNRRTLNPLAAKAFFYYSRAFELCNRLADIRSVLLAAHRTSSLRHDDETHATILNLLLRNYLHYNLYDQADKLQAKTTLKEDSTSSNQVARFRFYQGRIKGIQLDYTGAYADLQEAIRKAPQHSAQGFRQTVHKFACIVQLLMGEIPERSIFRQKSFKAVLKPYLKLTQAVRVGDLVAFHDVVKTFGTTFRNDKTYTLIQRLHHNVIKTGLRKINVSYSRISIDDICKKLQLDNVHDAESIVAKAIRDGVIDATIDHAERFIQSKENTDIYSTQEPLEAFHMRINFCLKMHNEAVKAMRYPDMPKKVSLLQQEEEEAEKVEEDKDKAADKNKDEKKGNKKGSE
ncbi:26S proteasome non-ATPase regulatory subunit 3 [Balamuthia mandrillaris]